MNFINKAIIYIKLFWDLLTNHMLYKCRGEYCGAKYTVEKNQIDEPSCPVCGSYYFSVMPECDS